MKAAKTFKQWLCSTLDRGEISDLAEHGADTGWPGMTYTRDCIALYNRFEDEIWGALADDAESFGKPSAVAFVAGFRRSDMANDPATFKNLLVWYMAERTARELSENLNGV